jgi:hypothetical protein
MDKDSCFPEHDLPNCKHWKSNQPWMGSHRIIPSSTVVLDLEFMPLSLCAAPRHSAHSSAPGLSAVFRRHAPHHVLCWEFLGSLKHSKDAARRPDRQQRQGSLQVGLKIYSLRPKIFIPFDFYVSHLIIRLIKKFMKILFILL